MHGHVAWGDGLSYYEYLPSLLSSHPLDFCAARRELVAQGVPDFWVAGYAQLNATGRCGSAFSFGWALLVAPFFALGHALALLSGAPSAPLGFGLLHESVTVWGASLLGALALVALYRIARLTLDRALAALAASVLLLSSNAIYYASFEAAMSHVAGLFCMAWAAYCWLKAERTAAPRYAAACAAFCALAIFVRPQLGSVGLLLAAHLLWRTRRAALWLPIAAAVGVAAGAEVALWHYLFGQWRLAPQGAGFLDPANMHVAGVLLSLRHGLFTWHPVYLLGLAGLLRFRRGGLRPDLVLALLAVIGSQIAINAMASDWWAGNSFGNRRFVDVLAFFLPGIACLLAGAARLRTALAVGAALVAWNGVFLVQYRFGYIPRGTAISVEQLVVDKFRLPFVRRAY